MHTNPYVQVPTNESRMLVFVPEGADVLPRRMYVRMKDDHMMPARPTKLELLNCCNSSALGSFINDTRHDSAGRSTMLVMLKFSLAAKVEWMTFRLIVADLGDLTCSREFMFPDSFFDLVRQDIYSILADICSRLAYTF